MSKNLYLEKVGKNAKTAAKELSFLKIKKRNDVLKLYSNYLEKFSNLNGMGHLVLLGPWSPYFELN